jgi:hypothetical protein
MKQPRTPRDENSSFSKLIDHADVRSVGGK